MRKMNPDGAFERNKGDEFPMHSLYCLFVRFRCYVEDEDRFLWRK